MKVSRGYDIHSHEVQRFSELLMRLEVHHQLDGKYFGGRPGSHVRVSDGRRMTDLASAEYVEVAWDLFDKMIDKYGWSDTLAFDFGRFETVIERVRNRLEEGVPQRRKMWSGLVKEVDLIEKGVEVTIASGSNIRLADVCDLIVRIARTKGRFRAMEFDGDESLVLQWHRFDGAVSSLVELLGAFAATLEEAIFDAYALYVSEGRRTSDAVVNQLSMVKDLGLNWAWLSVERRRAASDVLRQMGSLGVRILEGIEVGSVESCRLMEIDSPGRFEVEFHELEVDGDLSHLEEMDEQGREAVKVLDDLRRYSAMLTRALQMSERHIDGLQARMDRGDIPSEARSAFLSRLRGWAAEENLRRLQYMRSLLAVKVSMVRHTALLR